MASTLQRRKNLNNLNHGVKSRVRMVKITPKQKKVRNAELGFKNRQVKFSDEYFWNG